MLDAAASGYSWNPDFGGCCESSSLLAVFVGDLQQRVDLLQLLLHLLPFVVVAFSSQTAFVRDYVLLSHNFALVDETAVDHLTNAWKMFYLVKVV